MRSIVYNDVTAAGPTSLLAGVEEAACAGLGIRNLRHRSALFELGVEANLPTGLVAAAFQQVRTNWRTCQDLGVGRPSAQNWRWRKPQLNIAAHNASPEVVLERALIAAVEKVGRTDWSNQVPVASGVAGSTAERRRAIDLVRQAGPGHFQFIELKVASDTPLYAAIEIIAYACIWLVSREHAPSLDHELLAATHIDALVLAPTSYYARFQLGPLAQLLNTEIAALGAARGVQLSFAFEAFPDGLAAARSFRAPSPNHTGRSARADGSRP